MTLPQRRSLMSQRVSVFAHDMRYRHPLSIVTFTMSGPEADADVRLRRGMLLHVRDVELSRFEHECPGVEFTDFDIELHHDSFNLWTLKLC